MARLAETPPPTAGRGGTCKQPSLVICSHAACQLQRATPAQPLLATLGQLCRHTPRATASTGCFPPGQRATPSPEAAGSVFLAQGGAGKLRCWAPAARSRPAAQHQQAGRQLAWNGCSPAHPSNQLMVHGILHDGGVSRHASTAAPARAVFWLARAVFWCCPDDPQRRHLGPQAQWPLVGKSTPIAVCFAAHSGGRRLGGWRMLEPPKQNPLAAGCASQVAWRSDSWVRGF